MIHLPSLRVGGLPLSNIIDWAIKECCVLEEAGFNGAIVENFGDVPFSKTKVDDLVLGKLAIICHRLREESDMQFGLNILRNASVQALTLATVAGFNFIRSNVWEGVYVTDQGIIEGIAHDVIKRKNNLGSKVEVYADVFVKHATPLSDFTIVEAAEQALARGGADQVIISGRSTGAPIDIDRLELLNSAGIIPMVGSGVNLDNLVSLAGKVSGIIIGSAIKEGSVTSPISKGKAANVAQKWKELSGH